MGGNGFLLTCSCITFMPKKRKHFLDRKSENTNDFFATKIYGYFRSELTIKEEEVA